MSYCLNPTCQKPQNLDSAECCQTCGFCLQLKSRYRAVQLLGQGGFGRTFLAIDEGGKRQKDEETESVQSVADLQAPRSKALCVIKQFLSRQTAVVEPEAIALFHKEAQRLRALGNHPQIPALLNAFEDDQRLYLVQELIEGHNLEQVLAQGALTEAAIWQLLNQVLPLLKFIHDRQIIHRDIKPANLIWQRYGNDSRLVLVDFGAAKLVQLGDRLKTGTCIGSAEYVAPEQARGKAVFASDLYSLGVTCIHLLTNVSPFDLFDLVNDGWAWRQYVAEPVSDRLAAILDRLLQPALSKRFQSADAVMQAIERSAVSVQPSALTQSKVSTQRSLAIAPWHCLHILTGHTASVNALALSPNHPLLVSSSEDKTIRFWDLQTGSMSTAVLGHVLAVRAIAFSPDGEMIASGGHDCTVILTRNWSLGLAGRSQILGQQTQAVTAIAFTPNGQMLASASRDKTIKLWDVQTQTERCTLKGHRLNVTAIAFSPDGHFLASASADRTACLWTIDPNLNLEKRYTLADHVDTVQTIAFSFDSQQLATGGDDRTIKLWSTQTGRLLRTLPGHSWTVSALKFTPDGTTLISSSWDGTLKLWDLTDTQAAAIVLSGHSDSVKTIALSADGKTIVSGSNDKTIRVWQWMEGRDRDF
jgi:WD40 repeat protein